MPREMISKTGRKLKKCEVKLMDKECSSFNLLMYVSDRMRHCTENLDLIYLYYLL